MSRARALFAAVVATVMLDSFSGRADDPSMIVVEADDFTRQAPGLLPGQIEMTTVSTRPGAVTGPEVRVEVRGLSAGETLVVRRGGVDVSAVFAPAAGRPGVRQGLVSDLVLGDNLLEAFVSGSQYGSRRVALTVTDHPISGPVISGPHQTPFICETEASGMGPALDADCSAETQVRWYSRDLLGGMHLLQNPYAPYPLGTALTFVNGRLVPWVVRVESATINRGVARIVVLDDPRGRGPHSPFTPALWNKRVVYQFGASCGTGFHQGVSDEAASFGALIGPQGLDIAALLSDIAERIGQGYMIANNTLTTLGVHCNETLSAETFMMMKEYIGDHYGIVDHMIGNGGSGGAIQQHAIADRYPGLLDAGTLVMSYPDMHTALVSVHDCMLLNRVFAQDPARWNPLKQTAATGFVSGGVCRSWESLFGDRFTYGACPAAIPLEDRYDPVTNPSGVRCGSQENLRNLYGVDENGFAYRALDNVGVQYGLIALRDGRIGVDDFIALNAAIGGLDLSGKLVSQRTEMSEETAALAYRLGVMTGRGALDRVALIDQAIPLFDLIPPVDIHDHQRPFQMRARLDRSYGDHGNQALWIGLPLFAGATGVADDWLDRRDALRVQAPWMTQADLVAWSRPLGAIDQCRIGPLGIPVLCDHGIFPAKSPRQAAGGPLTEDNLKCQRKPVDPADYPANVSPNQLAQIRAIFPKGVCDWSKPSIGYTETTLTWQAITTPGQTVTLPYPLVRSAL